MPEPSVPTPATTVLGDWYAGIYDARPQPIVLCLNERSLLPLIVAFGDCGRFVSKFRTAALALFARNGVPRVAIAAEGQAMSEIAIGRTANRKVLGCLNEAALALSVEFDWMHERYFRDHEEHLSGFLYSTTQYRRPRELALELFQAAQSGSATRLPLVH